MKFTIMKFKIIYYTILACLSLFISCANLNNIDDVTSLVGKEAYMPNIDLFVFRGGAHGFTAPDLNQDGIEDENIVDYISNLFNDTEFSLNTLQEQTNMVFYNSKIRIIFITTNQTENGGFIKNSNYPSLDNTYRDNHIDPHSNSNFKKTNACPSGFRGPQESEYSLCALDKTGEPYLSVNSNKDKLLYVDSKGILCSNTPTPAECIHKCLNGDLEKNFRFTLTDITGKQKKGTVTASSETIRIFFAKTISFCSSNNAGVAGLSTVGTKDSIRIPDNRYYLYSAAISRDYTIGLGEKSVIYSNANNTMPKKRLRDTLSHELGHYFGLTHTFENTSCDYTQGRTRGATKNRIMDYNVQAEIFSPCEQTLYSSVAENWLTNKIIYALNPLNKPINLNKPTVLGNISFLDTKIQNYKTDIHNKNITIYDGAWEGDLNLNSNNSNNFNKIDNENIKLLPVSQ